MGVAVVAASALGSCSDSPVTLSSGAVLADVNDVPKGEAIPVVIGDVPVILAHTPEGTFRAFSAICTHQGCKVIPGADEPALLECPCHRSEFDTYTGQVLKGPAEEDLPEFPVEVADGKVVAT